MRPKWEVNRPCEILMFPAKFARVQGFCENPRIFAEICRFLPKSVTFPKIRKSFRNTYISAKSGRMQIIAKRLSGCTNPGKHGVFWIGSWAANQIQLFGSRNNRLCGFLRKSQKFLRDNAILCENPIIFANLNFLGENLHFLRKSEEALGDLAEAFVYFWIPAKMHKLTHAFLDS